MGSYQGRPQARQHPDRAVGEPIAALALALPIHSTRFSICRELWKRAWRATGFKT
jgi:hypothetical protein